MLGLTTGGNLNINYTEYQGADFNPGFDDTGGIPILYRLFSYFNFEGMNPSSAPLELRISANNLIVDDPDDVRLVCTGYAAPGVHVPGTDAEELWAIRNLTLDDLAGKNFTVGSFRTLSILPVTWLTVSAKAKGSSREINWSVAAEKNIEMFEVYNSEDPLKEWVKMGEIPSKGDADFPVFYSFVDEDFSNSNASFFQIKAINYLEQSSESKVVRLENNFPSSTDLLAVYPNPHTGGRIRVSLPDTFKSEYTQVSIYTTHGALISSFNYIEIRLSDKLQEMNPGIYIIAFTNTESSIQTRWIKK
tara:strand:- start:147 stop:1058 length:912 start_codon:yes stop_codon:yes gene_type:complete